jgi:uncharacterized protein YdeI (YjbR/CyaY-like superfamily)
MMNNKIDEFLRNAKNWQDEMTKLRAICLDCGLTEEFKWYQPCYTLNGKNIVIIGELKESCVLSFFKGALLFDTEHLLTAPSENVQAGRWIKFTSVKEIAEKEPILKAYIYEAIEVEKAGAKIILKKTSDYPVPEEFQIKLDAVPALRTAYEALTPGRQRGYLLYFSQPKLSKTRHERVEKYIPKILSGKGWGDE